MTDQPGEIGPPTLSRERTPERLRRTRRVTTSGFTWLPPEQVPGAVLSAEAQRRLLDHNTAWRAHHARARATGRTYVIYR